MLDKTGTITMGQMSVIDSFWREDLKAGVDNAPAVADPEMAEALRNYVPGTPEECKLVRKIDLYLMPILWIMYILNYVDRTNIVSGICFCLGAELSLTIAIGKCQDCWHGEKSGTR